VQGSGDSQRPVKRRGEKDLIAAAFLAMLEDEVTRLGLGHRVVFTGERGDIPAVLAALDVLLVPSVEEPFGRTVAEAMAAGTPVIATTVGGPPEIIEDTLTGLLAPPGEPDQWARAITSVLDDPEGAHAMSERVRAVALARFDEHLHAERMLEIFEAAT
jgi:L-malate glycosyltransferase